MKVPGRDVPWKKFLSTLYREWTEDEISDVAGALTFYTVLALFPFLAFLLGVASLVMTPEHVEALVGQLRSVAPGPVTQIAQERLHALVQGGGTGLLTFGGLGALWATSSGITAVMRALNTAYDVEEGRSFLKVRGTAIVMALLLAVLALAGALVVVAGPALASRFGGTIETAILIARIPVGAVLMLLAWALAYYVLPDVEQDFTFITPGSIVGVAVWLLASWGFSVYVQNFGNYDAAYGSIGGAIVLLLWLWISSQVFLLGAEINAVIEHLSEEGKRPGAKTLADSGPADEGREPAPRPARVPVRAPGPPPRPWPIATGLAALVAAFAGARLAARSRA